jgi:hypothetical protein
MPTIELPSTGTASVTLPNSGRVMFSNSDNSDNMSAMDSTGSVIDLEGAPVIIKEEYKAILTQAGVAEPQEANLAGGAGSAFVNTLGGAWTYQGVGAYRFTAVGKFADASKVNVEFSANQVNMGADIACQASIIDNDTIEIIVGTIATFASPAGFVQADDKLWIQPITIEAYT